jgi:replicative DNA helicase
MPPASPAYRAPAQDVETERALLGALMLSGNAMYDIMDLVHIDSFYAAKHKVLFEAMLHLFNGGNPIDVVSVSSRLRETKQLDQVGGATYISELVTMVPSASSARFYAQVVQNKSMLRRLLEAGQKISDMAFDETREVPEILNESEKMVYDIANASTTQQFKPIKESLARSWETLEKMQDTPDGIRGVPSGFADLDKLLSGFQKNDLVILAARPSMGKSSLMLDFARNAAVKNGRHVAIFSLEMSDEQLVNRMLAAEANVAGWKLQKGKLKNDDDYESLMEAMGRLNESNIYIEDSSETNTLKMRSVARRLKSTKGLDLIIVDYLQLIRPVTSKYNESMVHTVAEISRSLKSMAKELEVPVIALSQLSRSVEQRRGKPMLSDLRDSGAIEQDADVVMFIHREDRMNPDQAAERPNIAEIIIAKHRNGACGSVELFFDGEKTSFRSIEKSNFSDFASMMAPSEFGGGSF